MNECNTADEAVYPTPEITMVNVIANTLKIRCMGKDPRLLSTASEDIAAFGKNPVAEKQKTYPNVGYYSRDQMNGKLAKSGINKTEVKWIQLPNRVVRNQYQMESVADDSMGHDIVQVFI